MDCLKDYIGINGCGWVPPTPSGDESPEDVFSGLYINQLPGISLKSIERLADAEQGNFLGVWADVQRRALMKFGVAFKARINTGYSISNKTVVNCLACEHKESFAPALWYLMGVELMIERTSTDRLNRYTTIDLEKAEKLKAEFYTEYQAAFEDGMNSMDVKGSDCTDDCVPCSSDLMFVEACL